MVKAIRRFLTFIQHPYLSIRLYFKGTRKFIIKARCSINHFKSIQIGKNFYLGSDAKITMINSYCGETYKPNLIICNNVCMGNRCTLLVADDLIIEENALIASDVLITTENHGMNPTLADNYTNLPLINKPVHIKRGVWIGEKAIILPGVTIGERSIICAGAVVSKDVPDYEMWGGLPARPIKRFNFDTKEWERIHDTI